MKAEVITWSSAAISVASSNRPAMILECFFFKTLYFT
eukprot:CAMPEP_0196587734 /NCGR_PEP_ID=MMETSP1081-20130531/58445_1 /TAXON_ID=36882 /ORGANISM="Pyramimonas amylifera, Strain CCMP720" /LENGTH=36 /DNA_ID= /DNA_START= /DNA_END= /DNA_ORIENTATION=